MGQWDAMGWLATWYAQQCDEDWEHSYGIKIDTLDNPGWWIKIDLLGTALEGKLFEGVSSNMDCPDGDPSARWHHCEVKENQFHGACGVNDLPTVIAVFKSFAER